MGGVQVGDGSPPFPPGPSTSCTETSELRPYKSCFVPRRLFLLFFCRLTSVRMPDGSSMAAQRQEAFITGGHVAPSFPEVLWASSCWPAGSLCLRVLTGKVTCRVCVAGAQPIRFQLPSGKAMIWLAVGSSFQYQWGCGTWHAAPHCWQIPKNFHQNLLRFCFDIWYLLHWSCSWEPNRAINTSALQSRPRLPNMEEY